MFYQLINGLRLVHSCYVLISLLIISLQKRPLQYNQRLLQSINALKKYEHFLFSTNGSYQEVTAKQLQSIIIPEAGQDAESAIPNLVLRLNDTSDTSDVLIQFRNEIGYEQDAQVFRYSEALAYYASLGVDFGQERCIWRFW